MAHIIAIFYIAAQTIRILPHFRSKTPDYSQWLLARIQYCEPIVEKKGYFISSGAEYIIVQISTP